MKPKSNRKWWVFIALILIVGLDQLTKSIAKDTLPSIGTLSYLGDTFRLQYAENPGAFLGLGGQLPEIWRWIIFLIIIPGCLGFTTYFMIAKKPGPYTTLGLALTVGGGIGNLIDRVNAGRVIDFMNVGIGTLRTGIFNIADMAIVVGVILLAAENWLDKKDTAEPPRSKNQR